MKKYDVILNELLKAAQYVITKAVTDLSKHCMREFVCKCMSKVKCLPTHHVYSPYR